MDGSNPKVTVYTMDYCSYCEAAKALLKRKGIAFQEIRLDDDDEQAWRDLEKRSGMKTMPQIFMKSGDAEKLIGGYRELVQYLSDSD
ncbi:MAG: glutaredoxin [Bdellovibrionales bacterium]|nr:glutaredoxin [Bdellovibrionales bacterium]